jgi:glyoxylase-like metal-dependent hydrolase (beta-lactamase superfamily II)
VHDSEFDGLIDCLFAGLPRQCGAFLLKGEKNALVDAGPSVTVENVLQGMEARGVGPEDLDYILLTHFHLDHAGGASVLAERCPNANIVVDERSARYMADPAKLVSSAAKSLGDIAPYYGTMLPVPPERITALTDGFVLELGSDRTMTAVHTPGHSGGHFVFLEQPGRALFCGDCLGHYIEEQDYVYPATPAPEFDLEKSLASARRLLELEPEVLLFPHFGSSRDPVGVVGQFERQVRKSVELAESLEPADRTAKKLGRLLFENLPGVSNAEAPLLKGILEVNAAGVLHYLARESGG